MLKFVRKLFKRKTLTRRELLVQKYVNNIKW